MPTNNDALLRYHIIDECLQNHGRKWTWEDLSEKCTIEIIAQSGRILKNAISKRTIENDIKIMKGSSLGYLAPILRKNGFYSYEDRSFSIRNATISKQDIQNISAAIKMFKTYKGLGFFKEVENLVNRLEKQVHQKTYQEIQKIICFEEVPPSCGQEKVKPLMQAILNKQVLKLIYKKYSNEEEKSYLYHPYFLKEYRNRWYVLGWFNEGKYIKTFALDRISSFENVLEEPYLEDPKPNPETYFKNTIGITLNASEPENIKLKFGLSMIPYIKSQPLHRSQEIIEEGTDHIILSLTLTLNYELENFLLGFADELEILEPESLRNKISDRISDAAKKYQLLIQ